MIIPEWLRLSPHRPENDTVGENSADALFLSAGQVTHTWEAIEQSLLVLFVALTGSSTVAAMRAYGAVIGSSARNDMLLASLDGYALMPEIDLETIHNIRAAITTARRLGALRNIVAHSQVLEDHGDHFVARLTPDSTFPLFLSPALYNTGKTQNLFAPKIWYNASGVNLIGDTMKQYKEYLDYILYVYVLKTGDRDSYAGGMRAIVRKSDLSASLKR